MRHKIPLTALVILATGGGLALAAGPATDASAGAVNALLLRPGLYMLTVAGENVALQTGPDGALVVDSGPPGGSEALLAAIGKLTREPIRYLINTSASPDRSGGNAQLSQAGHAFNGSFSSLGAGVVNSFNAPIIAQANVLLAMSNAPRGADAIFYPQAALPSITYDGDSKSISLNGEAIELIGESGAHSDGDSVVLFRRSDVLVAGDIIDMEHFPVIDVAHGGSVQGEIAALNRMIDLVVPVTPLYWHPGGTLVIPARGRVGQQEEVVQYRDMVTIVRDRIQDLIDHHRTLAQIQASDPTAGYDNRYGASSGLSTTAKFVEAIYRSLTAARKKP
jgi:glyoxylase-like metal-dependent hydrolase (beta-lactamase superfamily II)